MREDWISVIKQGDNRNLSFEIIETFLFNKCFKQNIDTDFDSKCACWEGLRHRWTTAHHRSTQGFDQVYFECPHVDAVVR